MWLYEKLLSRLAAVWLYEIVALEAGWSLVV